jgi:DAPG hydrolase PhiG domain
MKESTYMGYSPEDYKTPYAQFFKDTMLPIQPQTARGLAASPFPKGNLPPLSKISDLQQNGYADIENGYTLEADGSIRIAILTKMPRVQPKMWDWWFAWHGSHDNRYKLWHPKAHKAAVWEDGRADLPYYVGRKSRIEEYIGASMEKALIQFIPPTDLGISLDLPTEKETFICARVGYRDYPLDFGYLVHHVRQTADGAEMRSRFFMGGAAIAVRGWGLFGRLVSVILRKIVRLPEQRAKDLMVHCGEEMQHLAGFLPEVYEKMSE